VDPVLMTGGASLLGGCSIVEGIDGGGYGRAWARIASDFGTAPWPIANDGYLVVDIDSI
jgi:hypothetical protein